MEVEDNDYKVYFTWLSYNVVVIRVDYSIAQWVKILDPN